MFGPCLMHHQYNYISLNSSMNLEHFFFFFIYNFMDEAISGRNMYGHLRVGFCVLDYVRKEFRVSSSFKRRRSVLGRLCHL